MSSGTPQVDTAVLKPQGVSPYDNLWQPPALAERQQLQQMYQQAVQQVRGAAYDFNAANDLLTKCIVRDPGCSFYVAAFLENLARKYRHNKRGSLRRWLISRAAFNAAVQAQNWRAVLASGPAILQHNPWDRATLQGMAAACEYFQFGECAVRYVRMGLEVPTNDVAFRQFASDLLLRLGRPAEAADCLTASVGPRKPLDLPANLAARSEIAKAKIARLTAIVNANPADAESALELAQLYADQGLHAEAINNLQQAITATGHHRQLREQLEEVRMSQARQQFEMAQAQAQVEPSPTSEAMVANLREHLNRVELQTMAERSQRQPQVSRWKLEVAIRLKRSGNYSEALQQLAAIHDNDSLAAQVALERGECWQHLRQFPRAWAAYQTAITLAESTSDTDSLKLALYRGGILGIALGEPRGREMLERLASLDGEYRDVAARLAQLPSLRIVSAAASMPLGG